MRKSRVLLVLGLCSLPLSACGGTDGTALTEAQPANAGGTGGASGPEGNSPSPVYALSTLVWSDTDTTGYVVVSDTLELGDLSLSQAREFPGYTSVAVSDGRLLVTNGESPIIQRFAITGALEWEGDGRLSLINEGVVNTGFFRQYMRRDRMAYAELDVAQRLLWDPVGFEVAGTELDTQLQLARDGLDLFANFNRAYFVFDGPILRPFSYHDQDWFRWAFDSLIAVYDPEAHTEQTVIDAPCPGLDTITKDESGNLYFSNWEYPALHALVGTGAAPCVARITPEQTLDAGFQPDLLAWTGGRHLMNFRYLRDGRAIAAVLEHDRFGEGFDFPGELSAQAAFWEAYGLNYRLWMFDLTAGTAESMRGLPNEDLPPSYSHAEIDGRFFLMLEASDFSHTTFYELGLDGEATRRFEVPGSSYQWVKVR
jgi:hypothetical protein